MLSETEQLSILVHLSKADNFVASQEKKLLHVIGEGLGLSTKEIDDIIEEPMPIPKLSDLPADEKFEYLFNTIQVMKVDKKIFQQEIEFCEKLALQLGYKPGVIADLSAFIYSDPDIQTKRSYLQSIADQHLISKQ
jgi:hypothetical protein